MPTTIVTGRDITFTIEGATYDAQATAATLTIESTINTYQTLDGKAYYTTDSQGPFDVEMTEIQLLRQRNRQSSLSGSKRQVIQFNRLRKKLEFPI